MLVPLPVLEDSPHQSSTQIAGRATALVAPCSGQSPVPDLLYEDQQIERLDEIRPFLEAPEAIDETVPLHRLTVFLTYQCNLACPYCKTIARSPQDLSDRPEKRLSYKLDDLRNLLESHKPTPIRHLHFTGGEASLIRSLPAMVELARSNGVEHISMTTNATLASDVYLRLAESGLNEIRVSLDAADPMLGNALTLVNTAWHNTIRTLEVLSKARRDGLPFFLIINTVVGMSNRHRLVEIVRFLLSFQPSDVKLITEVDVKGQLGAFKDAVSIQAELAQILDDYPSEAFPLLRRKIQTVFASDAIGLSGIETRQNHDWRCYIPLTERTVDRVYYYPCSVYLREGGRPLGTIDESQEIQRAKTAAFVRNGNCLSDPICQQYCLHCTREFNIRVNEARQD